MKVRCICCGASASLELLLANDSAREALLGAFKLGGEVGQSLIRYIALFRPSTRELSMDRVARLLNEVLPDISAGTIQRSGQTFSVPIDAWVWAIATTLEARDAGRLSLPLKGHGWLYEVLSTWKNPDVSYAVVQPVGNRANSKTLGAIAALEERARGTS